MTKKTFNNYNEITCSHCGHVQRIEAEDLNNGLVSYWGEDEATEYECHSCEKKFFIKEHVSRYWETAEKREDFNP